jgi:hypothetical protein
MNPDSGLNYSQFADFWPIDESVFSGLIEKKQKFETA